MAKPGFDPADAVDFWDLVNRQDWEYLRLGAGGHVLARVLVRLLRTDGDLSLDIRRYLADTLGEAAAR